MSDPGGSAGSEGTEVWDMGDGTQVEVTRSSQIRTVTLGGALSRGNRRQAVVAVVLGVVFVSAMFTLITVLAVWPGEAKLTGGLLCPSDQTDVFIVTDTVQASDGGTATDYTMYCVGERGQITEIHFLKPFAVLWAAHTAVLLALILLWSLVSPGRRRRRAGRSARHDETDFEPPGPIIS